MSRFTMSGLSNGKNKSRYCLQSRHQPKQAVFYRKLLNQFLYLLFCITLRLHSSDIDGIKNETLIFVTKPTTIYCNPYNLKVYYYFALLFSIFTPLSVKNSFSSNVNGCCSLTFSVNAASSFFRIFLSIVQRTLRILRLVL